MLDVLLLLCLMGAVVLAFVLGVLAGGFGSSQQLTIAHAEIDRLKSELTRR